MATIQKRTRKDGQPSFRVLARIDGKLHGETFAGAKAAEAAAEFGELVDRIGMAAAKEVRDQRSGRTAAQQAVPTVSAWLRYHIDEKTGITEGTRSEYYRIARKYVDGAALGSLPVDVVKRPQIRKWIRDQERGEPARDRKGKAVLTDSGGPVIKKPAAKTLWNRHGLLAAAFDLAVEEELRTDNPCTGTRISETETREMVFLTHAEFALLLDHIPPRWQPLAIALVGTGCRYSEMTALRIGSVHLDDEIPNIRIERAWKWITNSKAELGPPKTKKGKRTVYLGTQVADMFRTAIADRHIDELVFSTKSGKRITRNNVHDLAWQPAITAASATKDANGNPKSAGSVLTKRPRLHDLRHTYASWQIAAGVPLNIIRDQLGHESIKTTVDLYGHLMPDAGRAAAVAMSQSLGLAIPEVESLELESGNVEDDGGPEVEDGDIAEDEDGDIAEDEDD